MALSKGDKVIVTENRNWESKGTEGVVVKTGFGSNVQVSFEGKKARSFPERYLQKIG